MCVNSMKNSKAWVMLSKTFHIFLLQFKDTLDNHSKIYNRIATLKIKGNAKALRFSCADVLCSKIRMSF